MLDCIICIDDVNPTQTHRLLGTPVEKWLTSLHTEYGCKFTVFIPANYHGEAPVSKDLVWINELLSIPYIELAAHGYLHETSDLSRFGECEFGENISEESTTDKLKFMFLEWDAVGYRPKGWRNPGWLCTANNKELIESEFDWVALHKTHNMNMKWSCNEFYGHTGIHELEVDIQESKYIAFQSHIHGARNDNTWTVETYDQFKRSLDFLTPEYKLQFKTFSDICVTK